METQASRFPVRKMQKSVFISICTENDCCVPPPGPLPGSPWGPGVLRTQAPGRPGITRMGAGQEGRQHNPGRARLLWKDHRGLLLGTRPFSPQLGPSQHISPRNESVRAWMQGDMVEGQPQRERGPESVQALSKNSMHE